MIPIHEGLLAEPQVPGGGSAAHMIHIQIHFEVEHR